jgi:hypothetical protein
VGRTNESVIMSIQEVKIVEILPTRIWKEYDMMGGVVIKMQHEGEEEFTIAQINYDWRYTSNSHRTWLADEIMKLLGAPNDTQS